MNKMRQAKRRQIGDLNYGKPHLDIVFAGWGGLCSEYDECDEIHPLDDTSFAYTVGCTDRGHPELIIIVKDIVSKVQAAKLRVYISDMLRGLAQFAARRRHPFTAGEHLHCDETGLSICVEVTEFSTYDTDFPLELAIVRYGAVFWALKVPPGGSNDQLLHCPARMLQ